MNISKTYLSNRLKAVMMTIIMSVATIQAQEIYRAEKSSASVQLRTNGLYDLALCPNVGIEFQTDLGLAFQLDYIGAWWNSPSRNRFFSNYAFQTEIRYYLASPKMAFPYTGHHVGFYGQMATYDFEFGGKGYQSRDLDYTFGIGVSWGYTIPLNRHWCLDLTAGLGYFQSRYDTYHPDGDRYPKDETRRLKIFCPTKLEATFVWNINTKNDK
mgnify:CR=1 FL=1